jgi:hypothetical protein
MKLENYQLAGTCIKELERRKEKLDTLRGANEIMVGNINHNGIAARFNISDLKCAKELLKELNELAQKGIEEIEAEIENL